MECNHSNTIETEIAKKVGKNIFKAKASICRDCGASRWDAELQKKFDEWLVTLPSDSFMVQEVKLPINIVDFLEGKSSALTGKENKSLMIRALVSIWCNFVDKDNDLVDAIEEEYEKKRCILSQKIARENIRLNPKFYVQVRSQAELVEMSMQEFISACVTRISLAIMNEEEVRFYDIRNRLKELMAVA